jgi:hypothetical protein
MKGTPILLLLHRLDLTCSLATAGVTTDAIDAKIHDACGPTLAAPRPQPHACGPTLAAPRSQPHAFLE